MSVTGVLLAFQRQVVEWAEARTPTIDPRDARLPLETLVARARDGRGDPPTSVTLRSDTAAPATIGFPGGRVVLVDPYTGAILGDGASGVRAFFRSVEDWHRWLGASGDRRTVGRAVTGAANLGFMFLVASGIVLWWPRRFGRAHLRTAVWFRRGLSGRARDFNWHNAAGFWIAVPLFVVVLSGVVMSYGWANDLVYRAAGEKPPPPRTGPPGPPAPPKDVSTVRLEPLLARAEQQVANWRTIVVQLPPNDEAPVSISIDAGSGGQPQFRGQLTLDRATGDIRSWEPFSAASPGRRARVLLRFAHTGEALGLGGQVVAGLASAGAALLVWTGFALAWRRFRAWSGRNSRAGG